jgi:hypothetical protein
MANALGITLPNLNMTPMTWLITITIFIVCVIIVIAFLIRRWIVQRKMYNILVEITPAWSISEEVMREHELVNEKKNLFGKSKLLMQQEVAQGHSSYFVAGAYLFNKDKGIYYIRLKDKAHTEVPAIPYLDPVTKQPFFKPINMRIGKINGANFTNYIHLLRYSSADYKPIVTEFNMKKIMEIKNVYDSEATYIAVKSQEEAYNRFKKGDKLLAFAPWIAVVMVVILFGISLYIFWQGQTKYVQQMGDFTSQLGSYTKALMSSGK